LLSGGADREQRRDETCCTQRSSRLPIHRAPPFVRL
jgi:hypothetical protein